MPELPEVETTKRGIYAHVLGKAIANIKIRDHRLRWPVPKQLPSKLKGKEVLALNRRGKYLLFEFENGTLLWHLGMSGSLRIVEPNVKPGKHDHVDVVFANNIILRFNDPRRFGALVWTEDAVADHKLIHHLGPEPLTDAFNAEYLFETSRKRKQAIKPWVMDAKIVVGVGNIYANEALFQSRIHPLKAAGKLTKKECQLLCENIKKILASAIERGGTTLRDFVGGDGKPGYFAQELSVYGRGGETCKNCPKKLTEKRIGQRSTVYCTHCQK